MIRNIQSIALLTGLMLSATAQAGVWTGSVDTDYHTAGNWDDNAVPNGAGTAIIVNHTPGVVVTQDAMIDWGNIGNPGEGSDRNGTFTIESGNFSVPRTDGWFTAGVDINSHGTINMNGGTLTVGNDFMIGAHWGGSGTLNVNGGVITTFNLHVPFALAEADVSQQTGRVNLSNGVINVTSALLTNERGVIDITEGQLNIAGDWADAILTNQVAWGHITAYGGAGIIQTSYNAGSGMTEITAVELPPLTASTCWIDGEDLCWDSTNHVVYAVEYNTDLSAGTWEELTNGIVATPFTNTIPMPVDENDSSFFRVKASY